MLLTSAIQWRSPGGGGLPEFNLVKRRSRDLAQHSVGDLQDDERVGVEGGIGVKSKALDPDTF